jgi:hypothetical protein
MDVWARDADVSRAPTGYVLFSFSFYFTEFMNYAHLVKIGRQIVSEWISCTTTISKFYIFFCFIFILLMFY